jgi:hypothetical protein
MKTPVVVVTLALSVAILLAASLLIATGTHGEDALWPLGGKRRAAPCCRSSGENDWRFR